LISRTHRKVATPGEKRKEKGQRKSRGVVSVKKKGKKKKGSLTYVGKMIAPRKGHARATFKIRQGKGRGVEPNDTIVGNEPKTSFLLEGQKRKDSCPSENCPSKKPNTTENWNKERKADQPEKLGDTIK